MSLKAGGRRTPNRTRLPSVETLEKERDALELRRARVTYPEIARRLGYRSASGAYQAVQRAMARHTQGSVVELRAEEVDMLDRLHFGHWRAAVGGDVQSARIILQVAERRAKLLGLDAAVAIKATVTDSIDAQIEELVAELAEVAAAEAAQQAQP